MASKDSSLVFSIGSQRIAAARFVPSGGGLALEAYDFVELSPDISSESVRAAQTSAAIGSLASRLKGQKGEVVRVVLSAQGVYTKWVPVPPLAGKSQAEVIELEARQAVPFPLESARWGAWHGSVAGTPSAEALVAAVREDALEHVSEAIEGAGLTMGIVEVSPFALANAFRYNYPQTGDAVLLLDLGARAVSLIFIEGERMFLRTVNVGGFNISAQIAKEFGLGVVESEELKKTRGVVALGTQQVAQDEEQEALSKVIRNAMTRVHSEITRTLSLWRSQQGGSAPTKVYISGGGAALAYALEFLQEKVNLPIEYFNGMSRLGVAGGMTPEQAGGVGYLAGDLVGAALAEKNLVTDRLEILPETVALREDYKKRQPFLIGAVGLLALALVAVCAGNLIKKARYEGTLRENQGRVAEMNSNSQKINRLLTATDNPDTEDVDESGEDALKSAALRYEQAISARSMWVDLLKDFNARFNSDVVWLTKWEPQRSMLDTRGNLLTDEDGKAVAVGNDDAIKQGAIPAITAINIAGLYRGANTNVVQEVYDSLGGSEPSPWFKLNEADVKNIETFNSAISYGAPFSQTLPLAMWIPEGPLLAPIPAADPVAAPTTSSRRQRRNAN